jgi:hypothetical protein
VTQLNDDNATNSRQLFKNLSIIVFFHARRRRDSFLFTIIINFVKIEIWFDFWFIFDLVMQCINSFYNFFVMKIKLIVFLKWRVSQMTMFEKRINLNCVCWTTFRSWFVASCWINLVASLHKKWCKLKFFNKMCFSSSLKQFLTVFMIVSAFRAV